MRDSSKTEAERPVQLEFRKSWLAGGALLLLIVLLFRTELDRLPNRTEAGPRTIKVRFQPVELGGSSGRLVQVNAAWALSVADPRFGGISALAVDGQDLIALTDSGSIARFAKPGTPNPQAFIRDLPDGPGDPGYKYNRDSEALIAHSSGRGWWVAFENRDELWLYDRAFTRTVQRRRLDRLGLGRNRGIEGMTADGANLLLFPERGGRAIHSRSGQQRRIGGISGWISDAATLPDGRIFIVNRRPTPIGLRNDLVELERDGAGYRAGNRWRIPVGRLDNVEALAVDRLADGKVRLWMMTDNNFRQRQPTLLIALELKPRPAR